MLRKKIDMILATVVISIGGVSTFIAPYFIGRYIISNYLTTIPDKEVGIWAMIIAIIATDTVLTIVKIVKWVRTRRYEEKWEKWKKENY